MAMLVKVISPRHLILTLCSLVLLALVSYNHQEKKLAAQSQLLDEAARANLLKTHNEDGTRGGNRGTRVFTLNELVLTGMKSVDGVEQPIFEKSPREHREVFSISTVDGKFFPIKFAHQEGINPNIIPHPRYPDTWITVAVQQASTMKGSVWFTEMVCNAVFENDTMSCIQPPEILPIAATQAEFSNCKGDLQFFSVNIGPHDARVFYGPQNPYTIYGSNSQWTCFGQWVLDFRLLMDWGFEASDNKQFRKATEIQRPPPVSQVEKNFFFFWDKDDNLHAHYDIHPKRSYAKLAYNGSIGDDLSPLATPHDEVCMAEYMPPVAMALESIHQATNSLSITLCKRSNPACMPNDNNTFIMTIFQHKTFYYMHSNYEPYVMLFERTAPFKIYGISTKPIWISGRGIPGQWHQPENKPEVLTLDEQFTKDQTEMFYVTSFSWKKHGQKYHGYIDDVLFVAFGIEDAKTGGIDVLAGDLLEDLSLCADIWGDLS